MLLCATYGWAEEAKSNPYQFHYKPLAPRADVQIRAGKHRTMVLTELWMPLVQQRDRVVYGDLRYMDDNIDNSEGNIGIGYRQMASVWLMPERVWGVHAWLDRRRTQYNSMFYQTVVGFESLGNTHDLRANFYVPLSQKRHFALPFIGASAPYLVGTGVFYDRPGIAVEEPQHGFDFEVGRRFDLLKKHIDSFRVYNGMYHFRGNKTENVSGVRTRMEINITPSFSIGSRVQYDNTRGTQGFVEATLRFPFSAKTDYKTQKLRARLDESPERDIDIVSNAAIVDDGFFKPVMNRNTGAIQRILHVDNSSKSLGNGSVEAPYLTLKEAQDALRPYDLVYINQGDSSLDGMRDGLVLRTPNVTIVGAGAHLVYEAGHFYGASPSQPVKGHVIMAATASPVISNRNPIAGEGAALTIAADNISVKGIALTNSENGVKIVADGTYLAHIELDRIEATSNLSHGVLLEAKNGGSIAHVSMTGSTASHNLGSGVMFKTGDSTSTIDHIYLGSNAMFSNRGHGIDMLVPQGRIDNTVIDANTVSDNLAGGVSVHVSGNGVFSGAIERNSVVANITEGVALRTRDDGSLHVVLAENTIAYTYHPAATPSYGLVLDHDARGEDFNVDLGGGRLHSIGRNRIYNNAVSDVFLDTRAGTDMVTDGLTVSALYNYWGPAGLEKLSRVFSDDNESLLVFSKIDARDPLYY